MKQSQKFLSLLLSLALLTAFAVIPAAADTYGAQGTGGQTLTMLSPSDIEVVSTDGYYLNKINTVLGNTEDTLFNFIFGAGMNNYSDSMFTGTNLPQIGVYDSYGGTEAAALQYVGGSSAGITISIPAGTLADGSYVLVFGAGIQANNASKVLGKDIVFEFTVGEAAEEGSSGETTETPETPVALPYTDVDDWAVPYVAAVLENGCMSAASDTEFGSASPVTRADFVSILGMARGINAEKWTVSAFSDVSAGDAASPYIAWAADKGIVLGVGDGAFAPDAVITREQAAVMLFRYAQAFEMDTSASADMGIFSDKDSISDWAKDAVKWGIGGGYLAGNTDGTLQPQRDVTRVETAKLIALIVL